MFPARTTNSGSRPDPLETLPFDGLEFESKVAWMFGSPRTGSTWVLRMLIHPLVLGKQETGLLAKPEGASYSDHTLVVPVNESHLPVHLTPLRKMEFERSEGVGSDPDRFLVNSRHFGRPSYLFSDAHSDSVMPWLRCMVLSRLHSQAELARDEYGARDYVVAIKEPNGSHGAHHVMRLMPRSKLIFLMRDGRDVVDSSLTLRLPGGKRTNRGKRVFEDSDRLRYVRRASNLWVNRMNAVQRAFDAHDPALRLKVRYEDLRANPRDELSRLYDFLGLNRTSEDVDAAVEAEDFKSQKGKPEDSSKPKEGPEGRKSASTGGWRNSLSQAEQEVAEGIMAEKLSELGYE